ncbi:S8 family serine peptidase [Promicromonospora iranensis]|uniref:Subtilisin family serine protease n=1 Tax=Promicromonospora iranensis TaxID=1105144 RepID=A0ABU2CVJ9_9MICO|nr:S8 family serine peptidase [Promicromonospora iranensis]MDR7385360.1 subtilisin family serine protease [Promicromonospora iranensis]
MADRVTVTLLTGDRVTVTTLTDGTRAATVQPAEGRDGVSFFRQASGDRLLVIPSDVAILVGDRLDEALFDVAGLAAAGTDRDTVPVIVQQAAPARASGPATLAASTAWRAAGVSPERRLESAGAVADDLDATHGPELLAVLRAQESGASTRASAASLAIERVWLDAPVHALDVDSAPQIGAPEAWESGFTGKGVKVAVLDTGIDETHPDLDEAVVATKDFSGGENVIDRDGHGTHVAATVAGSGEASDGDNSGMAPGADLIIGKVLGDDGSGEISTIIEGMEWAAEQGADVINMSLGTREYGDGTDPMSVALDQLTEQHGALFVVAAGNDGELETIGAPAAASSALTVGAVDDGDALADFSSRGPRTDGAIKPDVTAPGVGIVAARAAGTTLGDVVDDRHAALGGTSMAAPHVAGAAAVLLQQRPDLAPEQAKALLMGSADTNGATVWEEGAGRIHIPSALDQNVTASPASVSFGTFEYPHEGTASDTVTYRNTATDAVELVLELAVTGPDGAPSGAAELSRSTVTVPARGTATVDVTVDRAAGDLGRYSGTVLATSDGGTTVRTPVGWVRQPEMFDLTVEQTGRNGKPFTGFTFAGITDAHDREALDEIHMADGDESRGWTFQVPAGTYSVSSMMLRYGKNNALTQTVAAFVPEITVDGDTTLSLDARKGLPVSATTPRDATTDMITVDGTRAAANGDPLIFGASAESGDVFVLPTEAVSVGTFDLVLGYELSEPTEGTQPPSYTYDLLFRQPAVRTGKFTVWQDDLATLATTYAAPMPGGTQTEGWWGVPDGMSPGGMYLYPVERGTRTEYVNAEGVQWMKEVHVYSSDGNGVGQFATDFTAYEPGQEAATTFAGAPHSPAGKLTQNDDVLTIQGGFSDSDGHLSLPYAPDDLRLAVWQDGKKISDEPTNFTDLEMPADGARYVVKFDGARWSDQWYTGASVSGRWTFRAEPGGSQNGQARSLLDVRYDVARIDRKGRAPRNTTVTLDAVGGEGAKVTGLRWSADDGATWHKATLSDGVARVKAPAGTTAISLRATATDAAGGTVKETTERAYLVK